MKLSPSVKILRAAFTSADSKSETRGQFHQRSTHSFYGRRSHKRKFVKIQLQF